MFVDYYALLSLHPSCSAKDVRDAFKRFALMYHPDRPDNGSTDNFREIKDAYDVLSDPARRYLYDLRYAEIVSLRQRQQEEAQLQLQQRRREREHLEELVRRQAAKAQPSRNDVHIAASAYFDSSPPLSTSAATARPPRRPLSTSQRRPRPYSGGRREGDEQPREAAAQAVPRQGSGLVAVRGSCVAETERSGGDAGLGSRKNAVGERRRQGDGCTSSSEPRPSSLVRMPSSHTSGDGISGINQTSEQGQMDEQGQQVHLKRDYLLNKSISVKPVLVPKRKILQWGAENVTPRRVNTIPSSSSELFQKNVEKTWRVFFHISKVRQ